MVEYFILVSGYLTMMTLIIVFIRWFQVLMTGVGFPIISSVTTRQVHCLS